MEPIAFLPGDLVSVIEGIEKSARTRVWRTEFSNPFGGDEPIAEFRCGEPAFVVYCGDEYVLVIIGSIVGYVHRSRLSKENAHV